jgi:DNA-binding transcriptional MerR regulator
LIVEKAPDAFRTISEVADEIDVPQHVLRFWESRFSHIRPMKRGGGRRYYRPDDVDLLRGIRHLLYGEGYTIRGVQRILREHGGAFVQNVWRVGAEPPPPLEEDAQDAAAEPAEDRAEPALFSELGGTVRSPEDRIGSRENRRKLETALDELVACRRIIDSVLQQQD